MKHNNIVAKDGLAQVDYSGRRFGALQQPSATEQVRRTPTFKVGVQWAGLPVGRARLWSAFVYY